MIFTSTGFEIPTKRTRKRLFLEEMESIVPWGDLLAIIEPLNPRSGLERPPFSTSTMLRIYFVQQWFCLSESDAEEALHDTPLLCEYAQLDASLSSIPDESAILHFRHLLETNHLARKILDTVSDCLAQKGLLLKVGALVEATLLAAPNTSKNVSDKRNIALKVKVEKEVLQTSLNTPKQPDLQNKTPEKEATFKLPSGKTLTTSELRAIRKRLGFL